jgi:flagellar protein FliJ
MNGHSNRYRLHHWQLAERQRYLKELESLGERLRADVERLGEEIDEAGGAGAVPANGRIDPLFVRPLLDRRDKLLGSIAEVDAQTVDARAAVAASHQEVKLVEGTMAQRGLNFEERLTRRARRSV